MLSQAQVVKIRKKLNEMYEGVCDVIGYEEKKRDNGSTSFTEEKIYTKQPCQLSYKTKTQAYAGNGVYTPEQSITLFCDPDLQIKPGCKIVVDQGGRTVVYKSSGQPAVYPTHQEIVMELLERWT